MGTGSSKAAPPDDGSAKDLRAFYSSEINQFLKDIQAVPRSSGHRKRDQPLLDLFAFADTQCHDNKIRAAEIEQLKEDLQQLSASRAELEHTAQSQADEIEQIRKDHDSEIEALRSKHGEKVQKLNFNHDVKVAELSSKHESEVVQYQHTIERIKSQHVEQIEKLNDSHARNTEALNKDKSRLVGQLLVNQDEYLAWTDDKLKTKIGTLQRLLDSATSPRNKEFVIPTGKHVGPDLDPYNFLARTPKKSHLLLKSVIWTTILREQFFSAPFGFGALGPGRGRDELFSLLSQFRKLSEDPRGSGTRITNDYIQTVFGHEKTADAWRSATFQCVGAAAAVEESSHANGTLLMALSKENMSKTAKRILRYLSGIAELSNNHVSSKVEEEVWQIARLVQDIALQFGVNPARLELCMPARGDRVRIGDTFRDYENGDLDRGSTLVVDLLIMPGFQKIGDGRKDLNTRRTIVPCDIYPEE